MAGSEAPSKTGLCQRQKERSPILQPHRQAESSDCHQQHGRRGKGKESRMIGRHRFHDPSIVRPDRVAKTQTVASAALLMAAQRTFLFPAHRLFVCVCSVCASDQQPKHAVCTMRLHYTRNHDLGVGIADFRKSYISICKQLSVPIAASEPGATTPCRSIFKN